MRIGIIGAGSVGRSLAEACRRLEHDVTIGVRDPHDPKHGAVDGRVALSDAVAGATVVLLAVPVTALPDLLEGLTLPQSVVLVDATNAVGMPPPEGFASVGAYVRSMVDPAIPVVKAFNTIGAEHMVDGRVEGHRAFLPVAGDPAGVDVVMDLARAIGFDPVALGGVDAIGMVEDHARLWIHLMRTGWGRDFGFGMLGGPGRDAG